MNVIRICSCIASVIAISLTMWSIVNPPTVPPRFVDSLASISMGTAMMLLVLVQARSVQCVRCGGKVQA